MNTAIADRRHSVLPTLNLLLASGAVVLGVIAIDADDVGSAPAPPAAAHASTIVGPAHPLGAADPGIPCDHLVYTRC